MESSKGSISPPQSNSKDYLFWFRTPQTGTIKTLFDSIKEVLPDGELIVTEDGIHLEGGDSKDSIIVNLFLEADKIRESGEFYCFEEVRVGIDMRNLNIFLKNAEPRHIITFCIEKNTASSTKKEDYLCIRYEDQETNTLEQHYVALIEPQRQRIQLPPHKYTCVREISSEALRRYIKTMRHIGSVCKITNVSDREFRFSTSGVVGEYNVRLISNDDSDDSDTEEENSSPKKEVQKKNEESSVNNLIVGEFKVKYLEYLIRPSNLCPKVSIGIDNEIPLIAHFQVASIGQIQYIIAQHIGTDD